MFFNFFKKKKKQIQNGDVVIVKRPFLGKFPNISKNSILKVEDIQSETAIVVFMNDAGNNIYREKVPLLAFSKVG